MADDIRLTEYTRFSGCGAKLGPGLLDRALCDLSQPRYPDLLVDFTTADDAGVYRIDEDKALVQTVDFFPPIVDDPGDFGRIAAANALSDVYAMGGRPVTAMSIVGFPVEDVDIAVLRGIMAGALEKLAEAATPLVGGHSIEDKELKFGLAVTGLVHPDRIIRNDRVRPGDVLILTKPLGTGVVNTALRAGMASPEAMAAATGSMKTLNRQAAEILADRTVHACTDVTGFGLLGHAAEMLGSAGVRLVFEPDRIPLLPGAAEYAAMGLVPAGTYRNRDFRGHLVRDEADSTPERLDLLFDPQTSGGLLAALPAAEAEDARKALVDAGVPAVICGRAEPGEPALVLRG